ncbi:glycosidase [Gardnerella vaginalis]|uniref:Alpha-amylase n=1 Tax=Gardnerella vaginalis TaxID=2702 RepID=A0A3E1J109_GARVA|nr:alpha-amylase family protein [Gardnerella vaginalis]RFD80014.1 glycosidase [Gardnerella vaginalis]
MIHSAQLQISERKKSNYARKLINNYKRNLMLVSCAAIAAVATVLMCVFTIVPASSAFASTKSTNGLPPKGVIVTAFQQNWRSIAKECKETYGPEGVKYVQVSPPEDHIKGKAWWTSYQPVSYNLNSKLGTEAEFKNMITTCKAAKVGIIVDAVINHTTGAGNKDTVGVGGSKYDAANQSYPDAGYTKDDFHQIDKDIYTYRDAQVVWNYRLVGLLDLDTSKPHVQQTLGNYFAKLLKMGVAGFRVDAVKHIAPNEMKAIKKAASEASGIKPENIWWMQETIGDSNGAKENQPDKYVGTGEVDEFEYSYRLRNYFSGSIDNLKHITDGLIPNKSAAIFVTNWDTERDNATSVLTYKDGKLYELANAFMLAYPYGTPNVYSGYKFSERDEGAPGATETSVPDASCGKDSKWQCTQRWTSIRGMIGFYNAVKDTKVTKWQDDESNNIAFSRGNKGFFAINNDDKQNDVKYNTDLPDGEYCNVYASKICDKTVTISGGKVETTIPAHSAVALHIKAVKHFGNSGVVNKILLIFAAIFIALVVTLALRFKKGKDDFKNKSTNN